MWVTIGNKADSNALLPAAIKLTEKSQNDITMLFYGSFFLILFHGFINFLFWANKTAEKNVPKVGK